MDARAFAPYNKRLDALVTAAFEVGVDSAQLAPSLDGECAAEVRKLVPLAYRRKIGAFFTSGSHRREVVAALANLPPGPYLDPTCGGGDLLLAATSRLPVGPDLQATLREWSSRLAGWDIHPEFTRATRSRILLAAAARHIDQSGSSSGGLARVTLPKIVAGDAMVRLRPGSLSNTVVLLNPPFGSTAVPKSCSWAEGSTSRAAVFVEAVLNAAKSSCYLVAILPDVLRTGSNYQHWRELVEATADIHSVTPLGLFDDHTDVDVFLLVAAIKPSATKLRQPSKANIGALWWRGVGVDGSATLADYFDVNVGAVVDNRDPHEGDFHPFITARDLPPQGRLTSISVKRRFNKRLFTPPFVVVRRTSRPTANGEVRAAGVLITGKKPVAVDNHLLVLSPKDGTVGHCEKLLEVLNSPETTALLDERMRCRHLTVVVLRGLPWLTQGSCPQTARPTGESADVAGRRGSLGWTDDGGQCGGGA